LLAHHLPNEWIERNDLRHEEGLGLRYQAKTAPYAKECHKNHKRWINVVKSHCHHTLLSNQPRLHEERHKRFNDTTFWTIISPTTLKAQLMSIENTKLQSDVLLHLCDGWLWGTKEIFILIIKSYFIKWDRLHELNYAIMLYHNHISM